MTNRVESFVNRLLCWCNIICRNDDHQVKEETKKAGEKKNDKQVEMNQSRSENR